MKLVANTASAHRKHAGLRTSGVHFSPIVPSMPTVVRRYRRLIKNPTIRERLIDQEVAGNRQFIDALIYRGWRVELSSNGSNNTYSENVSMVNHRML